MHDGIDLRAEVVEELLFLLLLSGDHRDRFLLTLAFLLKFADLVERSVEDAGGVRPCSFDGADALFLIEVEKRVDHAGCGDFSVDEVAAAHAPGCAGDLGGEVFFDAIDGLEGVLHVSDEEVVDFVLVGEDEIGVSI